MRTLTRIADMRAAALAWRAQGESISFVPTMGALHAGHLALMHAARAGGQRVVASIFVNPLQFGPQEDYARYPRDLAGDSAALAAAGVDALFAPEVTELYPRPLAQTTRVEVPGLSDMLCGAARPGHFTGVATVVTKLLNIVQPDAALFGEKDYQQLLVIRRCVADLALPVRIVGVPTVREPDGLAMSSRNAYLDADQRRRAPALYRILGEIGRRIEAGARDYAALERDALDALGAEGFRPDYVAVRRSEDLALPGRDDRDLIALSAAWLGNTRLIDNLGLGFRPGS